MGGPEARVALHLDWAQFGPAASSKPKINERESVMNNQSKNLAKLLVGLLLILTVTSGCNLSDIINPKLKITAVELNTEAVSLEVGESVTLSAIVYGDPDQNVNWQSSNTKLATVDHGEVSALAPGEVRITAFSPHDPTKSDFATINIVSANSAELSR